MSTLNHGFVKLAVTRHKRRSCVMKNEKLYKKYKLTKDEIAFIESMIKPME